MLGTHTSWILTKDMVLGGNIRQTRITTHSIINSTTQCAAPRKIINLLTIFIVLWSFIRGYGVEGIGLPKNLHRGSHPSSAVNSRTSRPRFLASALTHSLCLSYISSSRNVSLHRSRYRSSVACIIRIMARSLFTRHVVQRNK